MDISKLTISKFRDGLLNKDFSAHEVATSYLKNIEAQDKEIGAFLSVHEESALETASKVDVAIAEGESISPLAGVPLALKDNINIKNTKVTAGSKILENYIASYDAGVVQKLKEAQAVILGKTNLDEFAMGSSTENSAFKTTKNPLDISRVPGGSSGGSAAAVASNMALGALGSDTGGSIRQPAAFTGIVGLKTTYGSVSRSGLIAMASSLDQIGPFTKNVRDARLLFEGISGGDNLDATSRKGSESKNSKNDRKIKIGIPKEYFEAEGLDPYVVQEVEFAKEKLSSLGYEFQSISLPHTKYALACYYIVVPAEVSSNLARFDGIRYERTQGAGRLEEIYLHTRGKGFGKEVKRRIILGTFVLSSGYYDAYYGSAQKVRTLLGQDFENAFREVDAIFTPTTPTPAFKIGEKSEDPVAMYLADIFTIPVNLAGLPAISIPTRKNWSQDKLPVGFQLIGKHFDEETLFEIGEQYEEN